MKKYYSLLMMLAMMVAALSFTACGGDDEEDEFIDNSSAIVGTWQRMDIEGYINELLEEDEWADATYWHFKSNHTMTIIHVYSSSSFRLNKLEWHLTNNILTIKETEGEDAGYTGSMVVYKMDKKTMDLSTIGSSVHFKKVPDSKIEKYLK